MNATQIKALKALKLPDPAFKGLDAARVSRLSQDVCDALAEDPTRPSPPPEGFVALSAPRGLDAPGEKDPWPLLIAFRYTPLRAWEADFKQNALLIATDLRNGETAISFPYRSDSEGEYRREIQDPPSRTGPPPKGPGASGHSTDVHLFDLKKRFPGLMKEPRRLALALLYFDWPSNVVISERSETAAQPSRTTMRRSPFIKSADPGEGGRTSLTIPSSVSASRDLELRGALNEDAAEIPVFADEQGALASPITILFVKLDGKDPLRLRAHVPVRSEKGRVLGAFSLSVGSALPHAELEGAYQVYLIAGAELDGPYPLEILP